MNTLTQYLLTPQAIRDRATILFNLACEDRLQYFRCHLDQLDTVTDFVLQVIQDQYPDFNIPFHSRWRHFEVGNIPRIAEFEKQAESLTPLEQVKAKIELAIISVLLDAGAGSQWCYTEPETGQIFQRSEGLAVASFRMFCQGAFSSNPHYPLQADAEGLQQVTEAQLAQAFQVSAENPLVGLKGRVNLLKKLGQILPQNALLFDTEQIRLGNLVDYLFTQIEGEPCTLSAVTVFKTILTGLGDIWPSRYCIEGVNLGDVWKHPALATFPPAAFPNLPPDLSMYIPFHKLSQWLTYSLLEPLTELELTITELNELTGLAEYRNGGLCLDGGLLELKQPELFQKAHLPSSEIIVEWRSLTIILLDHIAARLREKLGYDETEFPLVKVLEGGTWSAGRKIAKQQREGGIPPLQLNSDGTVF